MNILEGAVGASLAQDTIYHLFDPSRRSGERDMRRYLHEVRYLEVLKTATELGISSLQLLTDCVLADGLDAGVVLSNGLQVDEGLAYMGIGEENTDSPSLLEHKHLREKTGERLIVVEKRAERMGKSVLEFVDDDADWDVRSMQASWRICC